MKSLAALLIFAGYALIYAATANQGKFATEPWAGLFADAYTTPVVVTQTQPVFTKGGPRKSEIVGATKSG